MLELATLISRHARYRRDATAVVFGDERLTYAQFGARVARSANMLRSLGIGKGDKVATVLGNSREALELVWAVPAVGAALVPLSPLLMPAGLARLLRDSDAKCLVSQRSMLPTLDAIRTDLAPLLPGRVLLIDGAAGDFGDYGALTAARDDTFVPERCGPDDLLIELFECRESVRLRFASATRPLNASVRHRIHHRRSSHGRNTDLGLVGAWQAVRKVRWPVEPPSCTEVSRMVACAGSTAMARRGLRYRRPLRGHRRGLRALIIDRC